MVRSRRSTLTRVVLVAGSVAASLGPAPRFSACEGHLRPLVDVLVFVELELERYLRATHTKKVDEHYLLFIVGCFDCRATAGFSERERVHRRSNTIALCV